ncbi:MAG: phosphoglycerate dehydrogenase [Planctomycetes bacterium]|nr:phosphoglycerate dehydrogenase [Planctomycetota bacterium]
MNKVVLTVEDRGLDYGPILRYLQDNGIQGKWRPLARHDDDELVAIAQGAAGVIAGMESWNRNVLQRLAPQLKIIARYGIGYDTVDVAAAASLGVVVTNTPGVLTEAVAELALGLYLCLSRTLPQLNATLHAGGWGNGGMGKNIADKTVGLVGFGHIGQRFAELLCPFGCTLLAYDPFFDARAGEWLGVIQTELDELLAQADCVSLHLPALPETENLVDAQFIGKMKPGAFLINTSRGKLVVEDDLADAIESGKIAAAGLDVFQTEPLPANHRFRKLDNILLSPHIGSATEESFIEAGMSAAKAVVDCLNGKQPQHVVKPV